MSVRALPSFALLCLGFGVALLLAPALAGAAEQNESQLWPEFDVYYRLNPNARLFFLLAPTREVENDQVSDITEAQIGAHVEVGVFAIGRARRNPSRYDADRMQYLRFRTGLRYLAAAGDDDATEWRIIAELTGRAVLPLDVHLALRNRLDLRWIDDAYSWRYRPRLWLEREFHAGSHLALVPYGSAEIFWDSRSDDWVRTRYQLGTAFAVKPWFAPELYWAHQTDDKSDGDVIIDALGIVMAFYF